MKKVLGNITQYIFAAFCIAILGLLMTLTYQALGRIFPTNFTNQIWGLILFDLAAMIWALTFVFGSQTTGQYAIAALGFVTGFIGTLIMVASEVVLGQNLMTTDAAQIGQWMVYGFIGATVLHAVLIYAHHASGPEIRQKIDVGIAKGEVTSEAIKQATAMLDVEKANLARTISDDILSQAKRDLGLYPIDGTPFDRRRNNLDVPQLSEPLPHPTIHDRSYPGMNNNEPIPHPTDEPTKEAGSQPSPFLKSNPE